MKKLAVAIALVIMLGVPMSTVSACGRNYHSRHHHHHFFQRHHVEKVVAPVVNDGSYAYYHDVLGYTKAQYLIQIKKMP